MVLRRHGRLCDDSLLTVRSFLKCLFIIIIIIINIIISDAIGGYITSEMDAALNRSAAASVRHVLVSNVTFTRLMSKVDHVPR